MVLGTALSVACVTGVGAYERYRREGPDTTVKDELSPVHDVDYSVLSWVWLRLQIPAASARNVVKSNLGAARLLLSYVAKAKANLANPSIIPQLMP